MLREFGLVDSPTVAALSKDTSEFSVNLSAEKASTLDADLVVFYAEVRAPSRSPATRSSAGSRRW